MTEEATQQSSTGQPSSGGPRGPEGLFTNADAIPKARPSTPGAIALAPGSVQKPYSSDGKRLDRQRASDGDATMTHNSDAAWGAIFATANQFIDKQTTRKQRRQPTPEGADSASSSQQQLDSSGSRGGERPSAVVAEPISGTARGSSSAAGPDTAAGRATATGSLVEALSDGRNLRRRGSEPPQSKAAPVTPAVLAHHNADLRSRGLLHAPSDFRINDRNYDNIESRTFRNDDDGQNRDRRSNQDQSSTRREWRSRWGRSYWHE